MIVKIGKYQLFAINPIPIVDLLLILYIGSVIIFSMIPIGNIISKIFGAIFLYYFVVEIIIKKREISINREIVIWAVWLIFCIISALSATSINLVVSKVLTILQLFIFFIISYTVIVKGNLKLTTILYTFLISVFIIYLYGFINQYNPGVLVTKNRITATAGDPNVLSVYGAFSFIIALFLIKIEKNKLKRLLVVLISLIIIYGIILTQSRQGILIAIVGLFLFTLLQIRNRYIRTTNKKKYLLRLVLYTFLSVVFIIVVYYFFKSTEYSYRFNALLAFIKLSFSSSNEQITKIIDYSAYERKQLIKYAIQIWLDNPLIGVGLDNFRVVIKQYNPIGNRLYAHNNYLELLSTIGTIGTIVYYGIYASIIKKLILMQKKWPQSSIEIYQVQLFLTIIFSLMVVELFTVTYYTKFTWIILLIIIGFTDRRSRLNQNNIKIVS